MTRRFKVTVVLMFLVAALPAWASARQSPASRHTGRADLRWWSLQPLRPAAIPGVGNRSAGNPIDSFVLAKLRTKGLTFAEIANRRTLIRRATYDLIGLPPTPAEIRSFLADNRTDAYERLVDRLLADPRYGERWARHWLDAARFGESNGFERDQFRPNAWRYRDYVVDAFNRDKSYFQFVREQIAGDILSPDSTDGVAATGFLVVGPYDEVGHTLGSEVMRARVHEEEMEEMVGAVGQTFLGLTANCARCHDHKFDPIPMRDYYRLKAALEGVTRGDRPLLPVDKRKDHDTAVSHHREQIVVAEARLAEIAKAARDRAATPSEAQERERLQTAVAAARKELADLASVPSALAALPVQPPPVRILARGDVDSPGDVVSPGRLSCVPVPNAARELPPNAPESERRRQLAEWIGDSRNPLASRVMVNRVWHYHFGHGIVASPNDFGFNGEPPSHPELLEWLASRFSGDMGGSIKKLHRLIMLSTTYRQSAGMNKKALAIDADNRLLWRWSPRRLEGEAVRDAMLLVSGQLNPAMGGPSFKPWKVTIDNSHFYTQFDSSDPEFNRRTLYRASVNSAKNPLLDTLDCPDPSTKTPRRAVTTTPLQALELMNNSFVLRQVKELANRIQKESTERSKQIELAYELCFGRLPGSHETERAAAFLSRAGLEPLCWSLLNATEFLYVR